MVPAAQPHGGRGRDGQGTKNEGNGIAMSRRLAASAAAPATAGLAVVAIGAAGAAGSPGIERAGTAARGTIITTKGVHCLRAIHPWMSGKIEVS
jgi:hypothetical protein